MTNKVDVIVRVLCLALIVFVVLRSSQTIQNNVQNDSFATMTTEPCTAEPINDASVQEHETMIPVCLTRLRMESQDSYFMSRISCSDLTANPNRLCTLLPFGYTLTEDLPSVPLWSWIEPILLIVICSLLFLWVLAPLCELMYLRRRSRPLMLLRLSMDGHELLP